MENLKLLFNCAHDAVAKYVEQQQSAYAQAVEEAKQARLRGNPSFPHTPDCPRISGLSVVPRIRIWSEADTDYFTNAKCDDCGVAGEING